MGSQVEITVSREVAEWLSELARSAPSSAGIFEYASDINQLAAIEAIELGLATHSRRPRNCAYCGKPLPVSGYGKPPKYCNGACKQAAYRERNAQWKRTHDYTNRPK